MKLRCSIASGNYTNQSGPHSDPHRSSTGSFIPFRERVRIGVYRGNVVAVKRINKKSVDLNRTILKELNSVKEGGDNIYTDFDIKGVDKMYLFPYKRV